MSFTSQIKEELSHVASECSHCEKATLAALIRIEGTLFLSAGDTYRMEIATDMPSVGRLILRELHYLYDLKTKVTIRRSVLHKTPNYLIEIPWQPNLKEALYDLGILSEGGGLEMGIRQRLVSKRCCAAAYLRGAFLGSGFISSPKSDFHFEIIVESEGLANGIVELMAERGIKAKIMQRRNSYMVYLKSGEAIMDFLALVGAHQGALLMEQERVVKSLRNDVNRQINAEIANQHKSANAAVDQLFAIKTVLNAYPIESLSPALQDFIRLRISYPDATLKELGEHADPPLSKSAINHRVRRLESLARDIKEKRRF
ncbi:MAG: DNA-binding protein WhiA [Eggerthellaceae bacterium]|nr:DNA-binding protein WhiA [Eggerthellaceae bacterium]